MQFTSLSQTSLFFHSEFIPLSRVLRVNVGDRCLSLWSLSASGSRWTSLPVISPTFYPNIVVNLTAGRSGHGLDKPLHQPTGLMSRELLTAPRRYETEIRDRDTMGRDLRLPRFAKCSTLQRPQFLWLYTCKPLSSEFIDDLINTERSARTHH